MEGNNDLVVDKKMESKGKKVFWGRGNGWVLAGLVNMLKELLKASSYRPYYEDLFLKMAVKIGSIQGQDGFWRASMLDPSAYPNPEVSSTAFFTDGLAHGINEGLLAKETYTTNVVKALEAFNSAVFHDGRHRWTQPIGEDPKKVTADMTEVYGVGGFLLAGTEMLKMID